MNITGKQRIGRKYFPRRIKGGGGRKKLMFLIEPKLETALASFENGEKVEGIYFANGRDETNKTASVHLECEGISNVISTAYGQSVLCKISSDDAEKLEELEESAKEFLPASVVFKNFIQDEKFFLKLGVNNDKYKAQIVPSANPGQLDRSPFYVGASLEIDMQPGVWIRFSNDECQAGLFMNIGKIVVDGGKKKKRSK